MGRGEYEVNTGKFGRKFFFLPLIPYDILISGFRAYAGGGNIKRNVSQLIVAIVILIFIGFVLYFINSFTGNPVSGYIAYQKIRDYAAATYPADDINLTKVTYNFKNSAYGCHAQSMKSEDTRFYISYSHGRVSDDYEYEVANHFTTYRRLSKDFNDMATDIIEKEYPYETTLIIGDLIGDTQQLTPDVPLNLRDMPLQLSLTVSVLSDVRNEDQMAALLMELHQLMLSKDIEIDQYTLRLEESVSEEGKPGSGNNLYLESFPARKITSDQESLASVIKKHQSDINDNDK